MFDGKSNETSPHLVDGGEVAATMHGGSPEGASIDSDRADQKPNSSKVKKVTDTVIDRIQNEGDHSSPSGETATVSRELANLHNELAGSISEFRSLIHSTSIDVEEAMATYHHFIPSMRAYLDESSVYSQGQITNLTADMMIATRVLGYTAQIGDIPDAWVPILAAIHRCCQKFAALGYYYSVDVLHPRVISFYAEA